MPPLTRHLSEQGRNLWILAGIGTALLLLLLIAGVALYLGFELPPHDLRTYYTSATGYAPPPARGVLPPGSIPRGAETLVGVPQEVPESPPAQEPSGLSPATGSAAHAEVPAAGERLRNPFPNERWVLELGREAYQISCAMCHGDVGAGLGPVGERYTPRPPNLAEHVPGHSDGYVYRSITTGIRSTPTPEATQYLAEEWHSFLGRTGARERWAIVAYLREATRGSGGAGH